MTCPISRSQEHPDQHAAFLKCSDEAIAHVHGSCTRAVEESANLQNLFYTLLETLGNKRQVFEKDIIKSEMWSDFGARRDHWKTHDASSGRPPFSLHTFLDQQYEVYGNSLCRKIAKVLRPLPHNSYGFRAHSTMVETTTLGRKSLTKLEILEARDFFKDKGIFSLPSITEYREALRDNSLEGRIAVLHDQKLMERIKKEAPSLYEREKLGSTVRGICERFPRPEKKARGIPDEGNLRSTYVVGTTRLEINGKLYALQKMITWMFYTLDREDPVDRMIKWSKVTVIHLDPFLIPDLIKEIGKLFEKAVHWKKEDELDNLVQRVALFKYLFALTMPFGRGSAAVGEWFEAGIYKYHGFENFKHQPNMKGDLLAITSLTLSQFIEGYPKTFTLGEQTR